MKNIIKLKNVKISTTSIPSRVKSLLIKNNSKKMLLNLCTRTGFTGTRYYSTNNQDTLEGEIVQGQRGEEEEVNKEIKDDESEPVLGETEKVTSDYEKLGFQAETLKLLDIVTHSLYSNKEVFVRELISNASDALEKLRQMQTAGKEIVDNYIPLEIQISCDQTNKQLIIQDFGIGMSKAELIKNLGTIAHSGTKQFLEEAGKRDSKDASNIIGQFGVGFYSVFMVAKKVKVYSRSGLDGADSGHVWTSDGSGNFSVASADGVQRGTKIIIDLKDEFAQFSQKVIIEDIIKKYSNFVGFSIKVNGSTVNTIKPIWTLGKGEITEKEHKEFYQFISKQQDEPMYIFQFQIDTPVNVRALFYVGQTHLEKYGHGSMDPGTSLFSRKVLIQQKARGLLPDWLRFVKGVVDSEDVPLSVSREHLQDNLIIQKIQGVLTKRFLKFLATEAQKDEKKYEIFFREFHKFLKEGILSDFKYKDDLAKLLRMDSSAVTNESHTSLDAYISRVKPQQKEIYFLNVPTRKLAFSSPYYEAFKKKGLEVLFLYTNADDFVMSNLMEYSGMKVLSIESAKVDLSQYPDLENTETSSTDKNKSNVTPLEKTQIKNLLQWIRDTLEIKVASVNQTDRLSDSPAIIVDYEAASMRRMLKFVDPERAPELPPQKLEINPKHPLIVNLELIRNRNPTVAKLIIEQIFDNALIAAGLLDDSRSMLPRLNNLMMSIAEEQKVETPKQETPKEETKEESK